MQKQNGFMAFDHLEIWIQRTLLWSKHCSSLKFKCTSQNAGISCKSGQTLNFPAQTPERVRLREGEMSGCGTWKSNVVGRNRSISFFCSSFQIQVTLVCWFCPYISVNTVVCHQCAAELQRHVHVCGCDPWNPINIQFFLKFLKTKF